LPTPFGDAGWVTPRVAAMAKRAGFDAAFMNIGGGLGTSFLHMRSLASMSMLE